MANGAYDQKLGSGGVGAPATNPVAPIGVNSAGTSYVKPAGIAEAIKAPAVDNAGFNRYAGSAQPIAPIGTNVFGVKVASLVGLQQTLKAIQSQIGTDSAGVNRFAGSAQPIAPIGVNVSGVKVASPIGIQPIKSTAGAEISNKSDQQKQAEAGFGPSGINNTGAPTQTKSDQQREDEAAKIAGFDGVEDRTRAEAQGITDANEWGVQKKYDTERSNYLRKQNAVDNAQIEQFQQQLRANGVLDEGVGAAAMAILRGKQAQGRVDALSQITMRQMDEAIKNKDATGQGLMVMFQGLLNTNDVEAAWNFAETNSDIAPGLAAITRSGKESFMKSMDPIVRQMNDDMTSAFRDETARILTNDPDMKNFNANIDSVLNTLGKRSDFGQLVDTFTSDLESGRLDESLSEFGMNKADIMALVGNPEIMKEVYAEYRLHDAMKAQQKELFINDIANIINEDVMAGNINAFDAQTIRDAVEMAPSVQDLNQMFANIGDTGAGSVLVEDWAGNPYTDASYESRGVVTRNMDQLWAAYKQKNPDDTMNRLDFLKKYGGEVVLHQSVWQSGDGNIQAVFDVVDKPEVGQAGSVGKTDAAQTLDAIATGPDPVAAILNATPSALASIAESNRSDLTAKGIGVMPVGGTISVAYDDSVGTMKNNISKLFGSVPIVADVEGNTGSGQVISKGLGTKGGTTTTGSSLAGAGDGNGTVVIWDGVPYRIVQITSNISHGSRTESAVILKNLTNGAIVHYGSTN